MKERSLRSEYYIRLGIVACLGLLCILLFVYLNRGFLVKILQRNVAQQQVLIDALFVGEKTGLMSRSESVAQHKEWPLFLEYGLKKQAAATLVNFCLNYGFAALLLYDQNGRLFAQAGNFDSPEFLRDGPDSRMFVKNGRLLIEFKQALRSGTLVTLSLFPRNTFFSILIQIDNLLAFEVVVDGVVVAGVSRNQEEIKNARPFVAIKSWEMASDFSNKAFTLVLYWDESGIGLFIKNLIWTLMLVLFAFIVFFFQLVISIKTRVVQPIVCLTEKTNKIYNEFVDSPLIPYSRNEISQLNFSFNEMMEALKSAQKKTESAEKYLENIIEQSFELVILLNENGLILSVNTTALLFFNSSLLDFQDKNYADTPIGQLVSVSPKQDLPGALNEAMQFGATVRLECEFSMDQTGRASCTIGSSEEEFSTKYLDISVKCIRDGQDISSHLMVEGRDTTARMLAQRAALRAKNQFRALYKDVVHLFNAVGDGIAIIGTDQRFRMTNRAFRRIYPKVDGPFRLHFCHEVFGFCGEIFPCPFEAPSKGAISDFLHPVGSRFFQFQIRAQSLTPGAGVESLVVTLRDVTERIVADSRSREKERRLAKAQKMAVVGGVVAGVAHEINNPAGVLSLNVSLIEEIWFGGMRRIVKRHLDEFGDVAIGQEGSLKRLFPQIDVLFHTCNMATDRIKLIVKQLRLHSRDDALEELNKVDLRDVLSNTLLLTKTSQDLSVRLLDYKPPDHAVEIICYPVQIEQVLTNVILNACDAMEGRPGVLSIVLIERTDEVEIVIRDDGVGVLQEHLEKLMDPFFTTKEVGRGTGLGLSLSVAILKRHGGTMAVEPRSSTGTKCSIVIPRNWSMPDGHH